MGKKTKNTVAVTLEQAKLILLAKAAEQTQNSALNWTQADSEAASLRTAHALGESADNGRMLVERARLVLATANERGLSTTVGTKARLPLLFAPVFILLAFVLGALTDRIASPEHLVNLLSPPFWTVIVWNLGVYIVLFLCLLGIFGSAQNRFGLPFRNALSALVEKTAFGTLKKGFKSSFYTQWSQVAAPLVHMNVARALHWAAVAFALGIITSLLVRGFGTAYWAGWESTWLSESPATVKSFIDHTYGLIPAVAGLPAMPDLETITQLRADRLPYLTQPVSAAPWLIRMMILMTVAVIIPRLILIAFNSWRMRRYAKHVTIDLDDPYYEAILVQCRQDAQLGVLGIVTNTIDRVSRKPQLDLVRRLWGGDSESDVFKLDFNNDSAVVPPVAEGSRKTVMLLWLDAMETPETDVHGAVIDKAAAFYDGSNKAVFVVWLDMVEFSERFKATQDRVKEREKNWTQFIAEHSVEFFVMHDTKDDGLAAVKKLRAWAAAKCAALPAVNDSSVESNAQSFVSKDNDEDAARGKEPQEDFLIPQTVSEEEVSTLETEHKEPTEDDARANATDLTKATTLTPVAETGLSPSKKEASDSEPHDSVAAK